MSKINTPDTLYILGTSEYGVSNVPVKISSENELVAVFGSRGTLINAYRKISDITNTPDIYLCKINGTHSKAYANIICKNKIINKGIEFSSLYSNKIYNNIYVLFSDNFMQIIHGDKILEYNFKIYNTVHSLFNAINEDAAKNICPITVTNYTLEQYSHPTQVIVSCNKPILELKGADDGLNDSKTNIYYSIKENLSSLKNTPIDVIALADCYIDDTIIPQVSVDTDSTYLINVEKKNEIEYLSFYSLLLDFCIHQSENNIITKGVLGFRPLTSEVDASLPMHYRKFIDNLNYQKHIDSKYLSLVSVCYGDLYYDNGGMIDNHYLAYAGVLASEEYKGNITNIDYGNNIAIRTIFTKEQVKLITACRFSITRLSPLTNKVHIVNGTTLADGVLSCEYSIRAVQLMEKLSDVYISKHIGDILNSENEKLLKDSIKECLDELEKNSAIKNYRYDIETDPDGNTAIICLVTLPGFIDPLRFSINVT